MGVYNAILRYQISNIAHARLPFLYDQELCFESQAAAPFQTFRPTSDMSGANQHRSRYKNAALDSQEMRRRREEEGIQLRKQKREQQLFKKRNVHADESVQVAVGRRFEPLLIVVIEMCCAL